ncbi:MAG: isoprenylcysteine carboxylmethyltransferase family protein [Chloroflexota bacterium]|nr:isoprenylcysteine carboxylmethyltransferase family protein [Chloroflexota bacterium]
MNEKVKEFSGYIVHILTIIAYFVLLFVLEIPPVLQLLQYFGFVFFALGIVFLVLSLRSLLGNKSGKLITKGVFAIVRHPMYLGGLFLFLAMVCFLPHWIMALLVLVNLLLIYRSMLDGDRSNINKFGDDYVGYMEQVPRINLITGIINFMKRKRNR